MRTTLDLPDPLFRELKAQAARESLKLKELIDSRGFSHRLWTDAYLAAFSFASGCRLVSFDADFRRFPGLNFLRLQP